jgi:metal-responsive CopG/Arc/MetJ family transcriptional regulator
MSELTRFSVSLEKDLLESFDRADKVRAIPDTVQRTHFINAEYF